MSDDEYKQGQLDALGVLAARLHQTDEGWEATMSDVTGADTFEEAFPLVLARLVGMTEIALRLLREAARYSPVEALRDDAAYLQMLALYIETEE
jgi:hypothetical protein